MAQFLPKELSIHGHLFQAPQEHRRQPLKRTMQTPDLQKRTWLITIKTFNTKIPPRFPLCFPLVSRWLSELPGYVKLRDGEWSAMRRLEIPHVLSSLGDMVRKQKKDLRRIHVSILAGGVSYKSSTRFTTADLPSEWCTSYYRNVKH